MDVLLTIEVLFAFILFFFLIRLTYKSKRYFPLLLFVLLSLFDSFISALVETGAIKKLPYLIDTNEPFFMLFGLLLFLYVRNQVHQCFYFKKTDFLLFIPFVFALLTYLPIFLQNSSNKLVELTLEKNVVFDTSAYIWEWNFYLVVNIYFLLKALRELDIYNLKLKTQLSNIRNSNLYYTQVLIKICIGLYVLEFLLTFLTYYGITYNKLIYSLLEVLSGVFLLLIAVDAILSHKYIAENNLSKTNLSLVTDIGSEEKTVKYASSGLNNEASKDIKERLLQFMKEYKPYLKPKLRIKELSEAINIPSHHLSQVINESFQQNFYEFINSYRIEEAMKILKDPKYKNYTYESIAFEVGFNSRSAFYTAFKKIHNTTPSKM
ncbi:AraC family transcriptional regulator [uncultured Tenacibaculum sp.]|uniref:helix-turn-helix domain-containing protein n=1 Tax=uncultured Tenacibaculum sp. TaxID=174713 RepID=UPI00260393A5|nr:AraC family transcriptional regulator [uncultured Tenacibaculum sp.]